MKNIQRFFIVSVMAFCIAFMTLAQAGALEYGRVVFSSARWSNGAPAFSLMPSEPSTATPTPNTYAAESLTGYVFRYQGNRYTYLGKSSGGRFVNQSKTAEGVSAGFDLPVGTYVFCFSRNGLSYQNQTGTTLPAYTLKTSTWYTPNGVAGSIDSAKKVTVTANTVTAIDDAVLPDQSGASRTILKGKMTRLTKYKEVAECRLLAGNGSSTGFDALAYGSTSGIFWMNDVPAGSYALRYAVVSSKKPSRLKPLSVFLYQSSSRKFTIKSGVTTTVSSFKFAKLPKKRKYPVGAANQFQRKLRAERWLAQRVPYSQTRWHEGYRTDCSGYGSMAWGLGRSTTTYYWKYSARRRATNDLKYGDVVILERLSGRPYHAVMFTRWIDKDAKLFEYMHLTGTGVDYKSMTWSQPNCRLKGYYPKYHSKMAPY